MSWSGEDSREAAELVKRWLPSVIQEVEVWVSSQDIQKGEKWSGSLWESLSEIDFGLLMITQTNRNAPWVIFEAGALSKAVKSRVIPILCKTDRLDVASTPLSQFQNSAVTREDIWQVIESLNSRCQHPIDEARLKSTYDKWWPDFESKFESITFLDPAPTKATGTKAEGVRLDKIESVLESIMIRLQKIQYNIENSNSKESDLISDTILRNIRSHLSSNSINKRYISGTVPNNIIDIEDVKNWIAKIDNINEFKKDPKDN